MVQGFKEFILRGNVIELAVAVVIGAAFTGIVNVIVSGLVNPLIGVLFQTGSLDSALVWSVPTLSGGTSDFTFGAILGAVINFVAVALVVYFVFVVPMNKAKERAEAKAGLDQPTEEPGLPTEQQLLVEIRDLLAREQAAPKA